MQSWQSKLDGRPSSSGELIPVGARHVRIGQWHPRAVYTDAEVELVRDLRDDGMTYRAIASKLEMPLSTVWAICNGRLRGAFPESWIKVK